MLYKKVDAASEDGVPPSLDLFTTPTTKVGIRETFEREYIPLNPPSITPHNFRILTDKFFLDGRKTRVVTRMRLVKYELEDGERTKRQAPTEAATKPTELSTTTGLRHTTTSTPIISTPPVTKAATKAATKATTEATTTTEVPVLKDPKLYTKQSFVKKEDNINVINGIGACFIKELKLVANGQNVYSSNLYSYSAYLYNLLNFTEDAKKSSMNSFGWYNENVGKSKTVYKDEHANTQYNDGWKDRRDLFVDGKIVEFSAPLYIDFLQQPNLLPSLMDLEFTITPQPSEFLVQVPIDFDGLVKLEILDIRIFATFVSLLPGITIDIEKKLETEYARYPMYRMETKTLFFDAINIETHSVAFTKNIPRQLYILMIDRNGYMGNIKTDPMYFGTFNLKTMHVKAGNIEIPSVHWDLKFEDENLRYIRAFEHFHRSIGLSSSDVNFDCGVNRRMFLDGYAVWVFNLTSSQENNEGFDFIREGITNLHCYFNTPIQENGVMVVVMGIFDSMLYLNKNREIFTDENVVN